MSGAADPPGVDAAPGPRLELLELLEANTQLTTRDNVLTEQIEKPTRKIHTLVSKQNSN